MQKLTIGILMLITTLTLAGCDALEDEDAKQAENSPPVTAAFKEIEGRWTYIHNNSERYITVEDFEDYYLMADRSDYPDEGYRGTLLLRLGPNQLEEVNPGEGSRYLIRSSTQARVTAQIAQPVSSSGATAAGVQAAHGRVGTAGTVLLNAQQTEFTRSAEADEMGRATVEEVPTGDYEVTATGADGSEFTESFLIEGDEVDLGALHISARGTVNFNTRLEYRHERRTSTPRPTFHNDNGYLLFPDMQYQFPFGINRFGSEQLKDQDASLSYNFIDLKIKNVGGDQARGVNVELECSRADWIVDCGWGNDVQQTTKSKDLDAMSSETEVTHPVWVTLRPFNSEQKNIELPLVISDSSGRQWADSVQISAYKKPLVITYEIESPRGNSGFVELPGRRLARIDFSRGSSNTTLLRSRIQLLPYIEGFEYKLMVTNSNTASQGNLSIGLGEGAFPLSRDEIGDGVGWARNYTTNSTEATAEPLAMNATHNTRMIEGEIEYFTFKAEDPFIFEGDNELAKNVLNDEFVAVGEDLDFSLNFREGYANEVQEVRWIQVKGPEVDLVKGNDNKQVSLTTPSLEDGQQLSTLTYLVEVDIKPTDNATSPNSDATLQEEVYTHRDFLSITYQSASSE